MIMDDLTSAERMLSRVFFDWCSCALAFSVRGEYEHAPSAAGFSQAVQDAIQAADFKGPQPASPIAAFTGFVCLMPIFL